LEDGHGTETVSLSRYTLIVLAVVAGGLVLAWPLGLRGLEPRGRWAALLGGVLAALNTLAAYGLARWSIGRSTNAFLGAVLGGMVGRMGLMLAAVVAGVLALGLPKIPLAISLLSYFVVFLVMELALLHKRTSSGAPVR
jgi:branched-subunit amino acid ABC-type transport system permease component